MRRARRALARGPVARVVRRRAPIIRAWLPCARRAASCRAAGGRARGSIRSRRVYTAPTIAARFATRVRHGARRIAATLRARRRRAALDRALGTAASSPRSSSIADSVRAALLLGLPQRRARSTRDDVAAALRRRCRDAGRRRRADGRRSARRRRRRRRTERAAQAENLRKMLLAMVEDIRVVLIKLAERTQALRFLMNGDERVRREAAREVLDLFAPLANRLGVWQLKWELEDLSPARARARRRTSAIAKLLDERRARPRALHRRRASRLLRARARRRGHRGRSHRPAEAHLQHLEQDARKQVGIDALYDIRAVRILVDDVKDCYTALGIVHHLWTPLPRRVRRLHRQAEGQRLPLAAHGGDRPGGQAARSADPHARDAPAFRVRRRRALALQGRRRKARAAIPASTRRSRGCARSSTGRTRSPTPANGSRRSSSSLFTDTIYVLTPQGKVVDLPRGATPVDFAYAVHTSLGHRCRGARVDGQMVPLDYTLHNGQQVEIIAAKQGGPSRDWLNPDLGYVHSHRARAKVRQWFKAQQLEETVAQGRALVERELARARPDGAQARRGRGEGGLRQDRRLLRGVRARRDQHAAGAGGDPAPSRSRRRPQRRARRARSRHAAEPRGGLGQRHPRRRRRPAADGARALLQAGAARSDRRLRHARQGRDDPSRRAAATSRACARASPSG